MSELEPIDVAERRADAELSALLPKFSSPQLSPHFERRLKARLAEENSPARLRMRRVMRWYWGLGSLAALAALLYALSSPGFPMGAAQAMAGLALLVAGLEILPGRGDVSLVELVRRTMR